MNIMNTNIHGVTSATISRNTLTVLGKEKQTVTITIKPDNGDFIEITLYAAEDEQLKLEIE